MAVKILYSRHIRFKLNQFDSRRLCLNLCNIIFSYAVYDRIGPWGGTFKSMFTSFKWLLAVLFLINKLLEINVVSQRKMEPTSFSITVKKIMFYFVISISSVAVVLFLRVQFSREHCYQAAGLFLISESVTHIKNFSGKTNY